MEKIWNKQNQSIEYRGAGPNERIWREGDLVYKTNPRRLNSEWKNKILQIFSVWTPPNFVSLIEDGYITRYIDGTDLHGNKPFEEDGSNQSCCLTSTKRADTLFFFGKAIEIGQQTGFTFGDLTCGNILIDKNENLFLIDYDVIVDYPLQDSPVSVWNNTLCILLS